MVLGETYLIKIEGIFIIKFRLLIDFSDIFQKKEISGLRTSGTATLILTKHPFYNLMNVLRYIPIILWGKKAVNGMFQKN